MNNAIGKSFDVLNDGKSYVKLVGMLPNEFNISPHVADLAIVQAARVSYDAGLKGEERDKKLINYLMRNDHSSPFEMVEFIFEVSCPKPIAAQWMRHRTWSYNEVSRRYTDEDVRFYNPQELRWDLKGSHNKQASSFGTANIFSEDYDEVYTLAFAKYQKMLEAGVHREQARMILPQGMYTKFLAKVDLKNLLDFIKKRASKDSQWEMQMFAACIYQEFIKPTVSWVAEAFEEHKYSEKILHKDYVLKHMNRHAEGYTLFLDGKHRSGNTIENLMESLAERYILVNYVEKE